jgi:hypothetical protein
VDGKSRHAVRCAILLEQPFGDQILDGVVQPAAGRWVTRGPGKRSGESDFDSGGGFSPWLAVVLPLIA